MTLDHLHSNEPRILEVIEREIPKYPTCPTDVLFIMDKTDRHTHTISGYMCANQVTVNHTQYHVLLISG